MLWHASAINDYAIEASDLSAPLILLTSAWRKERIRKGRNLMETNPGGPRWVCLLRSN